MCALHCTRVYRQSAEVVQRFNLSCSLLAIGCWALHWLVYLCYWWKLIPCWECEKGHKSLQQHIRRTVRRDFFCRHFLWPNWLFAEKVSRKPVYFYRILDTCCTHVCGISVSQFCSPLWLWWQCVWWRISSPSMLLILVSVTLAWYHLLFMLFRREVDPLCRPSCTASPHMSLLQPTTRPTSSPKAFRPLWMRMVLLPTKRSTQVRRRCGVCSIVLPQVVSATVCHLVCDFDVLGELFALVL